MVDGFHDALHADEALLPASARPFVSVQGSQDCDARAQPIELAAHPIVTACCVDQAGVVAQIVESAARLGSSHVSRDALEPTRHRDVDKRPQRAINEQQRIALCLL